jgi:hypothetical protein
MGFNLKRVVEISTRIAEVSNYDAYDSIDLIEEIVEYLEGGYIASAINGCKMLGIEAREENGYIFFYNKKESKLTDRFIGYRFKLIGN